MAALFKIPYFDYRHGYAMLGLGDVVFPGFLLAFAARLDAVTRGGPLGRCCFPNPRLCDKARYDSANRNALRPGCGYSPLLWAGYGTGLGVAQIANYMGWTIAGVQGQPALLYLVPLTCIPLLLFSAARGELCDIWTERNPTRPHGSSMCCCGSEENSSPSREPDQTDDSIQNLEETAGE